MEVIKVARYRIGKKALKKAIATLQEGGVVAFPTETAYGLAADPTNAKAVRRIYTMKGRTDSKAMPLIAGTLQDIEAVATIPQRLKRIATRHWPGPLTVVVRLRSHFKKEYVVASAGTVAIRIPGLALSRMLAGVFGAPLTSTSANRSGRPALYSGAAVKREFANTADAPDLLLDAGTLPTRASSTIISLKHGKISVVRQGAICL
ncbi:L-threonylcarbamoyladenylate synthase [Patescibacteria group bacterium]